MSGSGDEEEDRSRRVHRVLGQDQLQHRGPVRTDDRGGQQPAHQGFRRQAQAQVLRIMTSQLRCERLRLLLKKGILERYWR